MAAEVAVAVAAAVAVGVAAGAEDVAAAAGVGDGAAGARFRDLKRDGFEQNRHRALAIHEFAISAQTRSAFDALEVVADPSGQARGDAFPIHLRTAVQTPGSVRVVNDVLTIAA